MKSTIKRLVFGLLSSLLLAAGFAHAAGKLDPITHQVGATSSELTGSAADTAGPCDYIEHGR